MREIITSDVFKAVRIINCGNLKDTIINVVKQGQETSIDLANKLSKAKTEEEKQDIKNKIESKQVEMGISAIVDVLSEVSNIQTEKKIYDLIGGICEKSAKDIEIQDLTSTIEDITKICELKSFPDFFEKVQKLFNTFQK